MGEEKVALLDTDFIIKTNLIRRDEKNKWIDRIMELPRYRFYCHTQIVDELKRHDEAGAYDWMEHNIADGAVCCYGDAAILDELAQGYGNAAVLMYAQMLKTGCDAFRSDYFKKNFLRISRLDLARTPREQFLDELEKDSAKIDVGNDLGELKTYVLLQLLQAKYGEQIYVFCSDDKNARNGIISIEQTKCISVLSSFSRVRQECALLKEDALPYFQSYHALCKRSNQNTFRVWKNDNQMQKVPCEQVFEEMFDGKLEELQNGSLRYLKEKDML